MNSTKHNSVLSTCYTFASSLWNFYWTWTFNMFYYGRWSSCSPVAAVAVVFAIFFLYFCLCSSTVLGIKFIKQCFLWVCCCCCCCLFLKTNSGTFQEGSGANRKLIISPVEIFKDSPRRSLKLNLTRSKTVKKKLRPPFGNYFWLCWS